MRRKEHNLLHAKAWHLIVVVIYFGTFVVVTGEPDLSGALLVTLILFGALCGGLCGAVYYYFLRRHAREGVIKGLGIASPLRVASYMVGLLFFWLLMTLGDKFWCFSLSAYASYAVSSALAVLVAQWQLGQTIKYSSPKGLLLANIAFVVVLFAVSKLLHT